jgi:putative transposase
MVDERRYNGLTIGRRRVARLMRDAREWAQGSAEAAVQAHHRQPSRLADRPNLLDQDFAAAMPNQKWGADILLRLDPRGLALSGGRHRPVRPARHRLGNQRSAPQGAGLSALRRAVAVRIPAVGLSHHADRGRQDCSLDYQAELRKNGRVISMSGKANGFDTAMVETFFKTLKAERVWRTVFRTPD